jgi:hypothetical protein
MVGQGKNLKKVNPFLALRIIASLVIKEKPPLSVL